MLVSIDRAGRVVIPKEIRDRLDIDADTELDLHVEGESIRIERRRTPARTLDWVDGRPVFRSVSGLRITDDDVQRLRDAGQR